MFFFALQRRRISTFFEESVRGSRVFIIGSTHPSSDNLMEMLLMLDAAKRASADILLQ